MFKQQFHKTLLMVSLGVLFVLSSILTLAQTDDSVELVGIIEEMTATTITVNQQVIDISGAELNIPLEIGSLVKIQGSLSTIGEITVREINAPDEGTQAGEAEITGVLESFDGTTMVINGQVVDASVAEIKAGIVVGELVKVHVTANVDGTWQAREAEPIIASVEDNSTDDNSTDTNGMQPGEFEIIGTLEEIGDGFVVVSGQRVDISNAELKNMLVTGVLVKVHLQEVDGVLVAREIENSVEDDVSDNDNANSNDNTNDNTSNTNTANDNVANTNTTNDNNDDDNANSNTNNGTSVDTAVSIDDAITTVLSIYPNTTITEIELDDDFGDKHVWKIDTSHGIELKIDAQTGIILTIERDGNSNSNGNFNSNSNSANGNFDDNGGSNNNSNSNVNNNNNNNRNNNSNDNDDNDNSDRDSDDDDDDNSGMGSDDDDDDDNSGMGSDDDDD